MGEEVEPLAHREAGVEERQRVRGRERARDDGRVAAAAQQPQAAVHDLGGRGVLGPDGEVGHVGASPPGAEPRPPAPPAQGLVGHVTGKRRPGPPANSRLGYRARVLFVATDPVFSLHDTGRGHPERPARLDAVREGIIGTARRRERVDPRKHGTTVYYTMRDPVLADLLDVARRIFNNHLVGTQGLLRELQRERKRRSTSAKSPA